MTRINLKYIAIAAMTIDGKIAKNSRHISDWTSKEDKIFMRGLLGKCDVLVVGNNTYKTAIKPLNKRSCIVLTSKIKDIKYINTKLVYINPTGLNIQKFIKTPSAFAKGFGGLPAKNINNVGILGGAQTYTYCLQNNLLDELYLTIEPIIFGQGIDLFSVPPSPLPARQSLGVSGARGDARRAERSKLLKFKLLSLKKLNKQGSLLLHYKK